MGCGYGFKGSVALWSLARRQINQKSWKICAFHLNHRKRRKGQTYYVWTCGWLLWRVTPIHKEYHQTSPSYGRSHIGRSKMQIMKFLQCRLRSWWKRLHRKRKRSQKTRSASVPSCWSSCMSRIGSFCSISLIAPLLKQWWPKPGRTPG